MESWEKAAYAFAKDWQQKNEVTGIILTGSRIMGTASDASDIDIHVILNNKVDYRERGNQVINGFMVEYFANPVSQLKAYMNDEHLLNKRTAARMIATGKVVYDKNGTVKRLVDHAKKMMKKAFKPVPKNSIETIKYNLYDDFEGLKALHSERSNNFDFACNLYIDHLLKEYCRLLKAEIPAKTKLYKFLKNDMFRKKYAIKAFPDKKFTEHVVACLSAQEDEKLFEEVAKLHDYTMKRIGTLELDGWKMKSKLTC